MVTFILKTQQQKRNMGEIKRKISCVLARATAPIIVEQVHFLGIGAVSLVRAL
jgi:hypothetical protein